MIYYLILPVVAILLVVLQTTLADILFSGWLTLELSLVLVIYAGFRLDLMKGMVLSLILGFVFDCISGAPLGLFTLIYACIFLLSFFVSLRIVSEKLYLIALFSLICSLLESVALVLIYDIVFEFNMLSNMLIVFAPQALIISVLSAGFFHLMRKAEGLVYGKTMQPAQRTGTGGISTEA